MTYQKLKFDFLTRGQRNLLSFHLCEGNTLDTVIVSSLISAFSAIVVCIITSIFNNKLIAYRIQELEKKMDKHNGVIERVYTLEREVAVINERLSEDDGK